MNRIRRAVWIAAICLIAVLTCCGKKEKPAGDAAGSTAEQAGAESADSDLDQDSANEETGEVERKASMDLYLEDGDICTQFFRLTAPEEWGEDVMFHYFQIPEKGRYSLDIVEYSSMAATEGKGGRVFSIVLTDALPEVEEGDETGYLGTLENGDGQLFHVFIEHASGEQFTETSEEAYGRILNTADRIADCLEGRNGYSFKTGDYPGETKE